MSGKQKTPEEYTAPDVGMFDVAVEKGFQDSLGNILEQFIIDEEGW